MTDNRKKDEKMVDDNKSTPEVLEKALNTFLMGDASMAQLDGITAADIEGIAELGNKMIEEGKLAEAGVLFEGLTVSKPFDSGYHTTLGSIYHRQEKYQEAIDRFQRATELDPGNVGAWIGAGEAGLRVGDLLKGEGKTEEYDKVLLKAMGALDEAIRLDPTGKSEASKKAQGLKNKIG